MKMVQYNYFAGSVKLILAGAVIYGLAGCSTAKPPDKAQTSAPAAETAKGDNNRMAGAPSGQSSSLDQLKKGGAVGTPSSSPLKDIFFDFDRYDLRADARDLLKANAEWLKQNPSATLEIEGHCDERGTAEYNLALGAKRAQSAKDYLTTLGVDAQRMSTISYGQEIPVCSEHTEECWQKNRHDRFVPKSLPTS
jgi:peptidoglycan-associated lipoprotein